MNENRKFKFTKLTVEPEYQARIYLHPIESKEDFLRIMGSVWDQYTASKLGEDCYDTDEEFNDDPNCWLLKIEAGIEPVK